MAENTRNKSYQGLLNMAEGNGYYKEQLDQIQSDVVEIKGELSISIDKLTRTIDGLTQRLSVLDKLVIAVETISTTLTSWIRVAENVVPIKFVLWIMAGVLILVVLLFAGVEGIRALLGSKGVL